MKKGRPTGVFDPAHIVDAPEYYELARAMGTLTWGTWDSGVRPWEERREDFLQAHPPNAPLMNTGSSLQRMPDGSYGPADEKTRLLRLVPNHSGPGSIHERLSRFGLKLLDSPAVQKTAFEPAAFRETARLRNQKLRVLHGGVDVEPEDMDAAKANLLERQEKQEAAQQVRAARKQMLDDLAKGK